MMSNTQNVMDIQLRLNHCGCASLADELRDVIDKLCTGFLLNEREINKLVQNIEREISGQLPANRIESFRQYIYGLTGTNITARTCLASAA